VKPWKKELILIGAGLAAGFLGYIASRQPRVWCNRESAGLMLLRGGYRSWSVWFCDGFTEIDGRFQPVVIENGRVRLGYYRWPRFRHCDVRSLPKAAEPTNQKE
jgi:hypothetical protein